MIVFLSVIAPQNNVHFLSQDAKPSLRLQCDIAGNASEVAISFYTVAGWQHGSKHAGSLATMSPVPMRIESE